jgi:hypothetical protein
LFPASGRCLRCTPHGRTGIHSSLFAFFGEARDVTLEDVVAAYAGVPWDCVPNVLCFLDWGVVVLCEVGKKEGAEPGIGPMVMVPEFANATDGKRFVWARLPMGQSGSLEAANLATLQWAMLAHLDAVVLMPSKPDVLHSYLTNAGLIAFYEPEAINANRPPGDGPPDAIRA